MGEGRTGRAAQPPMYDIPVCPAAQRVSLPVAESFTPGEMAVVWSFTTMSR